MAAALPSRFEEPFARQYASFLQHPELASQRRLTMGRQRLQRTGQQDTWANTQTPATLRYARTYPGTAGSYTQLMQSQPSSTTTSANRTSPLYSSFPRPPGQQWSRDDWASQQYAEYQDAPSRSSWSTSPLGSQFPIPSVMSPGDPSQGYGYTGWHGPGPGPMLRRTSSDDTRLSTVASGGYYGGEASTCATSLHGKAFPQRRPSNRDEFDGPSQLLDKPEHGSFEPKEEELPPLPITLYAQEQDDILSKVNERLSQCAFVFIAKYQFPIPIEPDKRPVRVPGDREWSEWVYLLKRLATKRRIPSRVLFNGQIKQLITILENSLEMRHAAKHQSRPLKDDRNILQLISSGLQVAKILKDAPAMRYLGKF